MLFSIIQDPKVKPGCIPSLTDGAAQTLPLLSPFRITQNVNNERGELPGIETGQLLTSLRVEKGIVYSLRMNYTDISHNIIKSYLVYFCIAHTSGDPQQEKKRIGLKQVGWSSKFCLHFFPLKESLFYCFLKMLTLHFKYTSFNLREGSLFAALFALFNIFYFEGSAFFNLKNRK